MCLLTALAMIAFAGPAASHGGTSNTGDAGCERPTQLAQLRHFFTPKIPRSAPRCGFGQC
jgi:hypothetical protein